LVNYIWIHVVTNLRNNPLWFKKYFILSCCKLILIIWLQTICSVLSILI
jgi:hypothetical protein